MVQFGSRRDKCSVEVSIGRDRGQGPSNRECPDHIGAVGTYAPGHSQNVTDACTHNMRLQHCLGSGLAVSSSASGFQEFDWIYLRLTILFSSSAHAGFHAVN